MRPFHPLWSLLARVLLSIIFIVAGIGKLTDWSGTVAVMAAHGMPAVPLFLTPTIIIELIGGLALLLGWHTRLVALILFLYLIPVTLVFHDFWSYTGQMHQMQMVNFLKNLAIMGGLLEFFVFGANALSLDAARYRRGWGRYWPWARRPL
jgi:putative oxidoreductase